MGSVLNSLGNLQQFKISRNMHSVYLVIHATNNVIFPCYTIFQEAVLNVEMENQEIRLCTYDTDVQTMGLKVSFIKHLNEEVQKIGDKLGAG